MTKREIRKKGQASILKEGKTHQETYDALRNEKGIEADVLAEELAKIPSPSRMAATANLRYSLIVLLSLLIILRAITIAIYGAAFDFHPAIILPIVLLGILVPGIGIWAAFKGTYHQLFAIGLLIILSVVRGLKDTDFTDTITLVILAFVMATVGICFFVAYNLKSTYRKTTRETSLNGQLRTQVYHEFESPSFDSDELLDS